MCPGGSRNSMRKGRNFRFFFNGGALTLLIEFQSGNGHEDLFETSEYVLHIQTSLQVTRGPRLLEASSLFGARKISPADLSSLKVKKTDSS